jgi:hypothetical protein
MQYLKERYPNMCKWAKDCWQTDTNPILQSSHEKKTMKMKGQLQCCHWHELWCYFISKLVQLYVTPKQASWELEGPQRLLPQFQSEHLEHAHTSLSPPTMCKPLGSHMVGWKDPVHPDPPTVIGWTIAGRVHWTARKVKKTIICLEEHGCHIPPEGCNILFVHVTWSELDDNA